MATAEPRPGTAPRQLDSWKAIAAYLNRDIRTVQRWEREEGLPVHRHPHKQRDTVFASTAEIDTWTADRQITQPKAAPRPWGRRLSLAGLVGLLLAGGIWLGVVSQAPRARSDLKAIPLTTYPGIEAWPSLSPDGTQVAFAWKREDRQDFDLYIKVIGSDRALQLTKTEDWDAAPAWSPDGREIAFIRSFVGGGNALYTVSPLGGRERLLTEIEGRGFAYWWPSPTDLGGQLSWSPDGKWLAYPGIWLLSPATGEKRRVSPPAAPGLSDGFPAISPDGRRLAFVRSRAGNVGDVYAVALSGGEPKRLTNCLCAIFGLAWTASGREIVFSADSGGESSLWRVPADGGTPVSLHAIGKPASLPSIARQGRQLVFSRSWGDSNIWRVVAPARAAAKPPVKWIASTKSDAAPRFSPDGSRVAFTSNRSGSWQVWVCDRDGSDASQLTSFAGGAGLASWSPDGKSLAFNAAVHGNSDIYVISSNGGPARQLTIDDSVEAAPAWSQDGRWVYFWSNRSGRAEVWKIPAAGGSPVQVTRNGGHRSMESPGGSFVFYHKSPTLYDAWKIPVGGGEETLVLSNLRSRWTVAKNGLWYFDQAKDGRWLLEFFDFATGRKTPVVAVPGVPRLGQSPTVSPDGTTILYEQLDIREGDLMLVEDFR